MMKKLLLTLFLLLNFNSVRNRRMCDGITIICNEDSKKFNDVKLKKHDGSNIVKKMLKESKFMNTLVQSRIIFGIYINIFSIRKDLLGFTDGSFFWRRWGSMIGFRRLYTLLFMY